MNDIVTQQEVFAPLAGLTGSALDARVEIDVQISTAHQYPRRLALVAEDINRMVTQSQKSAEMCIYSLPRGGKAITGPSIRLAEILFSAWGNCVGGSRVVDVNREHGYIEAEGFFHDLQKNAKTVRRYRRRITDKGGKVFNDDMIIVTGQAAGAIAFRNAVLAGVPRFIWSEAYETAEQVLRGDIKTLGERHDAGMKAMSAFGLKPEQVYAILGISGRQDFSLDDIVTLTGLYSGLKQGETTAEELIAGIEKPAATAPSQGVTATRGPDPEPQPATRKPRQTKPAAPAEQKPEPEKEREPAAEAKPVGDDVTDDTAAIQATGGFVVLSAKLDEPHDPETGEVAPIDPAVIARHQRNYQSIVNDCLDGDKAEMLKAWEVQLGKMKDEAPDIHAQLLAEVEAM